MKENKFLLILKLFATMFKIGLFTFGGGYAMIALLENEFVSKKKWIEGEEFTNMIAIAESTPGPIAINSATYIGYKVGGFFGSLFATIGVCIPSIVIIFVISLFFDKFLSFEYVQYAFKGIQVCVTFLILSAGIKLFVKSKKTIFSWIMFSLTTVVMTAFILFSIKFSSVYYILIGALIGLVCYVVTLILSRINSKKAQSECITSNKLNNEEKKEDK